MQAGVCVHVFVLRLSEGKSLILCFVSETRVWWVHKIVEEWCLVPHLLLDLLVSVIQGNLFSALPHDGFCVAVAAKQGESWLLIQAHKGFCSAENKAAISASPDSCLFSQRGCHRQPTHPFVSLLELALNRGIVNVLARQSVFLQHNEEILLCGHHSGHKISSSYQFLCLKNSKKPTPKQNKPKKEVNRNINFL